MQPSPIDDKPLYRRGYDIMQETLLSEFAFTVAPVAIKFFYAQMEIDHFKKWHEYTVAEKHDTLSDIEYVAHTQNTLFLVDASSLTNNGDISHLNWQENDATPKPNQQLQPGLLGIAVSPLKDALYVADTVHFLCTKDQAEAVVQAWHDVSGVGPIEVQTGNTNSCEACVTVHNENLAVVVPFHSVPNSSESNIYKVILPADHMKHLVDRINEQKISLGPSPLSRPGDGFFRFTLG